MSGNDSDGRTKFMNSHKLMLFFAIIFIIIALVGLIALSGAQTGSSNTSGSGSMIKSSTGGEENGQINPTSEVVAEFFIIMFTILGVAMLTYVYTIKKSSSKLFDADMPYAALVVGGKKIEEISQEDIDSAKKDQLMGLASKVGIPATVISDAIDMNGFQQKGSQAMRDMGAGASKAYTTMSAPRKPKPNVTGDVTDTKSKSKTVTSSKKPKDKDKDSDTD